MNPSDTRRTPATTLTRVRASALALASTLLAGGCGSDSSIDDATGSGVTEGSGFNGSLSGGLVIERRVLDLADGRFGEELVDRLPRRGRFVSASRDGRNFYYIVPICRERPRLSLRFSCVVVLDAAGTEVDRLDPSLDLSLSAPDVFPDERFVAVASTEIHGPQRVLILGADGSIVDDADRVATPDDMGWAPDGTFYYVADNALSRASVGDPPANDERVIDFDGALGTPSGLSVSPDGTRLAVEFDTSEGVTEQEFSVWLMNADGSELRQFATVSEGSRATVRNPIWSPDGRYLLVSGGDFSLFTGRPTPSSPDFGGGLFALDTGVASHALDTFGTGDADAQILVRFVCDRVAEGCTFDDTLAVTGWVP